MARRRRKMTPFARFLIVMLILVPAAFIGASLFNGEDPMDNFRRLLGQENTSAESIEQVEINKKPVENTIAEETTSVEELPSTIREGQLSNSEVETLQNRIRNLEQIQEAMKEQLEILEERVMDLEQGKSASPSVN